MGVYIKGMEMPESCYDCDFTNDGFYLCKAAHLYKQLENDCEERRPDWCPLIEVPQHGRLIDADTEIRNAFIGGQYGYSLDEIEEAIDNAPTIIEAEEGET